MTVTVLFEFIVNTLTKQAEAMMDFEQKQQLI
ncbi:hypothetical protein ABIC56_001155 [Acinetobacter bereziniae]|nr:hypothetical protein [Acinetobacter bereziniae]